MRRGSSRLRAAAVAAATLGALLWGLAAAGVLLDAYFQLRPWLGHPFVFAFCGTLAFAVAWAMGIRHAVFTPLGLALLVVAAVGVAGVGWFAWSFRDVDTEVYRHPAPDGGMEAVVYSGGGFIAIDPIYVLRLETDNGLRSRETTLGCVNSDVGSLGHVEWVGPRTLRAHLSRGETFDIVVDERGNPDRRLERGC